MTMPGPWSRQSWLGSMQLVLVPKSRARQAVSQFAMNYETAVLVVDTVNSLYAELAEMRERFHSALVHNGTDREHADAACAKADALIAKVGGLP